MYRVPDKKSNVLHVHRSLLFQPGCNIWRENDEERGQCRRRSTAPCTRTVACIACCQLVSHGDCYDGDSGDKDDHYIDQNGDDDADAKDIVWWG